MHRIELKDQRIVLLCPESFGDFNDFRDDKFEIKKLQTLNPIYNQPEIQIESKINIRSINNRIYRKARKLRI